MRGWKLIREDGAMIAHDIDAQIELYAILVCLDSA